MALCILSLNPLKVHEWLPTVDGACDLQTEEVMRKLCKRCIAWLSYPLVGKSVHGVGLRKHAEVSVQHVGAAHVFIAQVVCVGIETTGH